MKGYKQTKVGLIPKDWEVVRLGEVGDVCMCKRIFKNQTFSHGEIPFYKIGTFGKDADAYISRELYEEYKSKYPYPKKGTILISASGTIGRAIVYQGEEGYFQDSNIVWIDNDEKKVLNKFLYYVYQFTKWDKYVENTTISRLYNDNLKRIAIPLPPLKEQKKIAKILSTWDEAIESQEKLIKEKEKLKKALMQRLLKVDGKKREPKVRFKEFSGEWVEKRLGEILVERKEYATKEDEYVHLSMSKEGIFPKIEQFNRDFLVKDENKKYKVTKKGDICYNPANLKFGVICENDWGDGIFSPIYVTFEVNKNYNKDFIKYIVTSKDFIQKALKYQEGTVYERMAVKPDDLLLMKIFIPPTLEEQQKIAKVLSTIDKEIDLLKLELNELKKQKKALMQKLLTGKVRVRV